MELLTAEDRLSFDRDGFLLVRNLLPAARVRQFRDEADRLLNFAINVHVAARRAGRLRIQWRGDRLVARTLQPVNDLSPAFTALCAETAVTSPLSELMGDEPRFAHEKIIYKQTVADVSGLDRALFDDFPAGHSEGFVPHTDFGWYSAENDYPDTAITCAIHLDDSAGRGPLLMLPGSNHLSYKTFRGGDIDPSLIETDRMVEIDARAGDALLFHSRTVHASGENNSGSPRRIFMATFCPSRDFSSDPDRRSRPRRERAQVLEEQFRNAVASGTYAERDYLHQTVAGR